MVVVDPTTKDLLHLNNNNSSKFLPLSNHRQLFNSNNRWCPNRLASHILNNNINNNNNIMPSSSNSTNNIINSNHSSNNNNSVLLDLLLRQQQLLSSRSIILNRRLRRKLQLLSSLLLHRPLWHLHRLRSSLPIRTLRLPPPQLLQLPRPL